MNISKKLTLSFVGLTSVILIATLVLARWSFERGFTEFLHAQEMDRLSRIAQDITTEYLTDVSDITQINRHSLDRLLGKYTQGNVPPRGPRRRGKGSAEGSAEGSAKRPPLLRPGNDKFMPSRIPPPELRGRFETALFGINGELVAGVEYIATYNVVPITFTLDVMHNEERIGVLTSWNDTEFTSPFASSFARQQMNTSILIGVFCLSLAMALSYYASQMLLQPLRAIIHRISTLSKGNYTARLAHQSRDEFDVLANNINHLADKLEKNKTAKSRWFADISHELRTPLTILMGELEALKLGIRPLNQDQIDSLLVETQLLSRLIDDLYQLSTSDLGALHYQFNDFNLSELVMHACEQCTASAAQSGLVIHPAVCSDIRYNGDAKRIKQLLTNLLNNAIAYTDPQGVIEVQLLSTQTDITLIVSDSAPSIDISECEHIFEPLYRHDKARTRNTGGAGLGLAICKNIASAHSGTISAEPALAGGIKITVVLPISCDTTTTSET